jgi:hypothetical protein
MDPGIIKLFGVMMAIMLPIFLGVGLLSVITAMGKRIGRPHSPDTEGLQHLRERLEQLEARDARIQDLEERLDFVERVLPALREGRPPLGSPRDPHEKTPV